MLSEVVSNPDLVREFGPDDIIESLSKAKEVLFEEPPFLNLKSSEGEAIFIGDTHGDFRVTKHITQRFIKESDKLLIFIGDYIDREPEPEGAIYNVVFLCILKTLFPNRVYLLKGNHEAHYAVFCYPYEFDKVLIDTFGSFGVKIHKIAVEVFREMPLMIKTKNGVIASHAGFPMNSKLIDDKSRRDLILDILWADVENSPIFRGYEIPRFNEDRLIEFLQSHNASLFIRGHDPYLAGKIIFSKKCITIFTSRRYALYGGIKIARVNLAQKIENADNVFLEDITSYFPAFE